MKILPPDNLTEVDRRVFSRMRLTFPLAYRLVTDRLIFTGYCRDIGSDGIGIFINKKLEPKTKVELWLEGINNAEPLHITGEVVWSNWQKMPLYRTYRAGIRFDRTKLFHLDFNKIAYNA